MADEVTKKDQQSLQGYCNEQIADMEKRLTAKIEAPEKSVIDQLNKAIEGVNKNDAEFLRGHTDQPKRLDALEVAVNKHAKVINERR